MEACYPHPWSRRSDHTPSSKKPVIFISYPSEDQDLAKLLATAIRSDFLSYPEVFIASQLDPGQQWQDEIREKLLRSVLVCVLRSEKDESRWVSMELGAAWAIGATVIPICYGALKIAELPEILNARQAIHIADSGALGKLYNTIARTLGCNLPTVPDNAILSIEEFQKKYKPQSKTVAYAARQTKRVAQRYEHLPDGTDKIISPITGTLVWEVSARGKRPIPQLSVDSQPIAESKGGEDYCPFCETHYVETTPEISRLGSTSASYDVQYGLSPDEILDSESDRADFRRIPNLFPIVSYDYWRRNYGFHPNEQLIARWTDYVRSDQGKKHVEKILKLKTASFGDADQQDREILEQSLFCGSHDLIVARRHYELGATRSDKRVGSGQLTIEDHRRYFWITAQGIKDLFEHNEHIRYVAVFQNWLSPAGATLNHLHRQLVGIDEYGLPITRFIEARKENPEFFNHLLRSAFERRHIVAQNDHAIAFVEVGRRYPTIAVYSKNPNGPQDQTLDQVQGMSDMVRACHAALPVNTPTNEEWYYTPPDSKDVAIPWHVLILLRTNVQAGFEHATRIYINSYPSALLVDRVTRKLDSLARQGQLEGVRVGCTPDVQHIRLA